ncbi:MAG: transcriptional repressor LexA [Mogibacterium sp.]|nr:transcriptional repressor LexA [Mogibacterium sp.]
MKKSEERQSRILEYMKRTVAEKGFPPTVREICTALNIKSTSTVHSDLKVLEQKGLIKKDPSKPRALLVVQKEEPKAEVNGSFNDITTTMIPIIGRVAAGTPILADENIEEYVPFPARFVGSGTNFILTVHGTSMVNAGINDGDYIIVREEHEARNGDIVVAMIQGEYETESTVKRYYKENGHIRLQPENDYMEPIIVDDCKIVGKVQGVFRYLS